MPHESNAPAYGLWPLVIINSALFIMFAFSFAKPQSKRDWRSLGAFSAFIVALFTEMYGFPLTIYFLAPWLQTRFPGMNLYTHDMGHLWYSVLGWKGDPHLNPIHLASQVFIVAGFWIVASAWNILLRAQKERTLATSGPYRVIRHPQYAGFILVMFGFLLQWPTIITLVMFPILVVMYTRLVLSEEAEVRAQFPSGYAIYAGSVPRFFPKLFSGGNKEAKAS
jgi:protein-S-isoprenylcysteine O-methyltransferase Ste14